ncbi:MAG TPA: thiol reductant ABC exporter subunit CydD, partial [Tahibacter sp.]|nr:thiol reductant ABC exporter subunit CydD [Tahibacter sp.]
DASLWLLDEPLAHLDAQTAAPLRERLAAASEGCTLLIATHAVEDRAWVDRVLELDRGRLAGAVATAPA